MFAGGDADTKHPEEFLLEGITMENLDQNLDNVNSRIKDFEELKNILDDTDMDYDKIKKKYNANIADLYDNVPYDSQSDYNTKCYISSIELHAYNDKGDLFIQDI